MRLSPRHLHARLLEARELTLKAKENDYEELLLMSHDANQRKELAKQELTRFESVACRARRARRSWRVFRSCTPFAAKNV